MTNIENDLQDTLALIDVNWKMQSDFNDKKTNFIYTSNSLVECLNKISLNQVDKQYTLHRWYNYMTSVYCENLFCEFGAKKEKDIYNHNTDIYISGISFDVKLTIYPSKLSSKPFNLKTRFGKDNLIKWFYQNQSQQSRKQLVNRIYLVCDGKSPFESLKMKSNFSLLRQRIKSFMEYTQKNGFNALTILDEGRSYKLFSDIIYLYTS
jgi:hypothetical protein